LEEVFTVDTDDVFLSLDGACYTDTTCANLRITCRDIDRPFMTRLDTCVIVVLTRDEIGLLEGIDELRAHDGRLTLELSRKE
jgi:Fe-S cluster biogenesis protein NfuA